MPRNLATAERARCIEVMATRHDEFPTAYFTVTVARIHG
jgi:hypothetical protein